MNPDVHTSEYRLVKNAALDSFILIQDTRSAPSLPAWLGVLPALLDTKTMMAYRAESCLKKLISIDLPIEHTKRLSKVKRHSWD